MSAKNKDLLDVQQAYPKISYKDYVDARNKAEKDRLYTSSINALGSVGATFGAGTMIAGDKDTGSAIGVGALSGLGGYHGARLLNLPPGLRVLMAAISATAGSWLMHEVGPYRGQ